MAPYASKHYPVIGLAESSNPRQCSPCMLQFHMDSTMSLAKLGTKSACAYLKEVICHLKRQLKMFPDISISIKLTKTCRSVQVSRVFTSKVTQQMKDQQPTMLNALEFLNKVFFQSHAFLKNVRELCRAPKIDDAEINMLTELKERLFELAGLLDRILMFYSINVNSISSLPSLNEVKRCAKKSP